MDKEKDNSKIDKREVAIKVENLSKTFRIPHEKTTTLKGAALGLFSKKNYTEFKALNNINFEVKKGEFFGIIGRNGSGKSTLLKILAGIYVPDKGNGKITINGKLSPFLELGVGFNPELTGRENLFLGGAILGLTRKEVTDKLDKIVAFSELEEFIDMKLKNYSSGMQVRLAFSLAINAHAEILLMDEVLAVGDSNFQAKCIDEFNRYKKEGKTVILVTHDIPTVQRYCGRAMLLKRGVVERIGPAKDISDLYLEENIADFREHENLDSGVSGPGIITRVKFLDGANKEKALFKYNEDIIVELTLKRTNKKINFGVALFRDEDTYIFGTNSFIDSYAQNLTGKTIRLTYKKPGLKGGVYYVKVAIFGQNEQHSLQYLNKSEIFRIAENSTYEGCVNINHIWS